MKLVLAMIVIAACSLRAQVVVQAGKQAQVPAPDATAAVTLDAKVAEATVQNGVLTIVGAGPGDTRIVAVSESHLEEIVVHVLPGLPSYPPGFVPPQTSANDGGSYEFRFDSDRAQLENAVDLYSQGANETRQIHIVSTSRADSFSDTFVPSAYYRIATPGLSTTFLDQSVSASPLTVDNVTLRGFHLQDGPWQFHGGYTASADFANIFIPAEKEFAAGISYSAAVNEFLTVSPELYLLRSDDLADGQQQSGLIGGLLFDIHFFPGWALKSEVAYGRGPALATLLEHSGPTARIKARLVKKDSEFPSLRSSSLPGLSGDLSWSQTLNARFNLISAATINDIRFAAIRQDSSSASSILRYKISQSWSAGTGINYGSFANIGSYADKTLALPQQINFDRVHFGAGFQYQISTASDSFSLGNGFQQTARVGFGRLQIGEFADWQTDALSISSLYSQIPGLQRELQKLGITAVTPDQLAALLQDAAFLQTLGLSTAAQVITVPRRSQEGAILTWSSSGPHPHRLNLLYIQDRNAFATSFSKDYSFTGAYSKEFGGGDMLQLSCSVVESALVGRQQTEPLFSVSFRHQFFHAPAFLATERSTSIQGTVFIDSKREGRYQAGMQTVPRASVVLDGRRTALTDRFGHFRFGGVSAGNHRIQLQYSVKREHFFTTPQDTIAAGGSTVDFGIAFPTIDLWGYVEDDTGNGMANVNVQLSGASGKIIVATQASGKFFLSDIQSGDYAIAVDPATVAVGYATSDLTPMTATVTAASASHPTIKIPAMRVLTGTVTAYDSSQARYVPIEGAVVSLPGLARSVTTGTSGRFTIGGLPPGDLDLKVTAGRSTLTQTIEIPTRPVVLKANFRVSALDGKIALALASAAQ